MPESRTTKSPLAVAKGKKSKMSKEDKGTSRKEGSYGKALCGRQFGGQSSPAISPVLQRKQLTGDVAWG